MSARLPADLLLIESYARQIEALCAAALESANGAGEGEEDLSRVAALARTLNEHIVALRRRHPLPGPSAPPGLFA